MNKLYEIIKNCPEEAIGIDPYDFAQYLTREGVRVYDTSYLIADEQGKNTCSACGGSPKDLDARYCPFCGARILSSVSVLNSTVPEGIPSRISVKIPTPGVKYRGKRSRKKKYYRKVQVLSIPTALGKPVKIAFENKPIETDEERTEAILSLLNSIYEFARCENINE